MWPFKRKQPVDADLPKEVKDYYQAERRERVGVAWLLALATLVTTLLLAIGIFFGGRWVYRKTIGNDNKPVAVVVQPKPEEKPAEKPSDTPAPQPTPAPTPTPTPSQTQDEPLPNTGPADLVQVFTVTTVSAALAHNLVARCKLRA